MKQYASQPLRLALEFLCGSANEFVSALALTWMIILMTVMRFVHVQRMTVLQLRDMSIEFFCSQGKSIIQGSRRPFYTRMLRKGISGLDVGYKVDLFHRRKLHLGIDGHFWLPDFGPARASLGKCNIFLTTKMSQAKFINLSIQMFNQVDPSIPSSLSLEVPDQAAQ